MRWLVRPAAGRLATIFFQITISAARSLDQLYLVEGQTGAGGGEAETRGLGARHHDWVSGDLT